MVPSGSAVRYRGGYWLLNFQFAALAFTTLGVPLAISGVFVAASTGIGTGIAMSVAGIVISAGGLTGFVLQRRCYVEIDDRSRTITISRPRSTAKLTADEVMFRLPLRPSLFPGGVHYVVPGARSTSLIWLGQGQHRTPEQLTSFAEHLQRSGIRFDWA